MSIRLFKLKPNHEFGISGTHHLLPSVQKFIIPKQSGTKTVTVNKMGFMKNKLDFFSREFVSFASKQKYPVLEIGACYGIASVEALKKGAVVVANDIADEHLSVIYQITPKEALNRLYLNLTHFPKKTQFKANSFGAVLACRIFHFLTGKEVEEGLKKIHKWLVLGGKFYFVTLSPYHFLLKEKFLPLFKQKLKTNEKWPGIINNMHEYNPLEKDNIPNFLHVFDELQLINLLKFYGFAVERIKKYDYDEDDSLGLGYIGFIAKKLQ